MARWYGTDERSHSIDDRKTSSGSASSGTYDVDSKRRGRFAASQPVVLSEIFSDDKHRMPLRLQHSLSTVLITWLFIVSLTLSFSECVSLSASLVFAVVACVVAAIVQVCSLNGVSNFVLRLVGIATLLLNALAALLLPSFRAGLFSFCNQLIMRFDDVFNAYVPLFPAASSAGGDWVFSVLMGILLAFCIWELLANRLIVILTIVVFALSGMACWLDTGENVLAVALSVAAWFASWRLILGNRLVRISSVISAVLLSVVFVGVAIGVSSLYQPSQVTNQVRGAFIAGVDTLRYGDDSLPEGDLSTAASLSASDEARLDVAYRGSRTDDLYLRGFVGADLTSTTWMPLSHSSYEGTWTGMYSWLNARDFDPQAQRAAFDDEVDARMNTTTPTTPVDIQVTGADRKYVYAPTTTRTLTGASVDDAIDGPLWALGLRGPDSYSLQVDEVVSSADSVVTPSWLLATDTGEDDTVSYSGSEAVYRAFVYENYLGLSDEDRALMEKLFYDRTTWNVEDPSASVVISRVRVMLSTLATYTDTPQNVPAGVDFASWFLEGQREGNSAYFATAAVLAFREQGIPARYVEGYRASVTDATPGEDGVEHLSLTSADAHAWVEVYLDGIGWSPVEVSPGFYRQPYRADTIIEVNQNTADESSSNSEPAGALGGDVDTSQTDDENDGSPVMRIAVHILFILAALVVVLAAVFAGLEIRRNRKRTRLLADGRSDDQNVAVPALYDQLTLMAEAAGVAFDPARPRDGAEGFSRVFSSVTTEEYERIIELVQRSVFGRKILKPFEMRALRSFNVRIVDDMRPPSGLKEKLLWRYRYLR